MTTMTKTEFLKFLIKLCDERIQSIDPSEPMFSDERGRAKAYADIKTFVLVFLQDYKEEHELQRKAQQDFLKAIETDVRKQFDDPAALVAHIRQIASRPPFLGSENLSLAAIDGFCRDWLEYNKKEEYKDQVKQATF